ncbi:uncharacterized protein N7496_000567 [Penicillium cataractarum]|uniref:DUF4470 domain-containing protein n=1 Tax=Penicillium cataractarum TaxID=2100454 RepID=A0A9W9VUJ9_9EURO|nr:uncharacterized protein N7496_000567 [Penicillium cataractarum]KAJ5389499.1 hypothetical protein N7496_000567 [Penicillium cataractarum]
MGDGIGVQFGGTKYLWGNVPAFDILEMASNEGETYAGDLHLLFAASGDLRNVIKTIAHLPSSYDHSLEITINDRDLDIAARNLIFLLVALIVENRDEAIDCIIHLWYSALVRVSDIEILNNQIRPLIQDVCEKVKSKSPKTILGKTWTFGKRNLRIVLQQTSWNRLLSFFDKPVGLTAEMASQIRADNTLAHSRRDYRDRYMTYLTPPNESHSTKPNPTFFQTIDMWPMKDNADPHHGWSLEEVSNTSSGAATADTYGKLFFYIRGVLDSFLDRVSDLRVSFKLLNFDAFDLPDHLDAGSFSRIDVSNISDIGWLGIHRTLYLMVPLLQTPAQNPHATLITLFMNAVDETLTVEDQMQGLTPNSRATKTLLQYLPPTGKPSSTHDPTLIKFSYGRELVGTYDHIFERYMRKFEIRKAGDLLGAMMKENHTIIEKWPYRLKLRPGQPGAQDEFDRRMRDGVSGKERYVEWKRVHQGIL